MRSIWVRGLAACASVLFALSACAAGEGGPQTLTVMTHDSFSMSEDVLASFERAHNTEVVFLQSGDAGAALNKAILLKDSPLADLFFGVDNTFLSRALEAGIFEQYQPAELPLIPEEFRLDATNRLFPVDYGDVCINYDRQYFAEHNLPVPDSLEDLTRPAYDGLLVVENPATSSTGLAFLLATRAHFGHDYLQFWAGLKDNRVTVVDGWETAYYANFSGSSGRGDQPMVVSYASSPAAEVIFADPPRDDAPTASITADDTCFRQVEFVGILKGARQRGLAEEMVSFMLDVQFQEDVPLQMFVFPVRPEAVLPEAFVEHAARPLQPAAIDPAEIAANRDRWISEWTQLMFG